MKICVAQTRPFKGDIQRNIDNHKKLLELAASHRAETVVFPELSITGYEPTLARELATDPDDPRLAVFQQVADARQLTIGIGVPTNRGDGVCITMVLFQPNQSRQTYSKQYLHADEEPFFVGGQGSIDLLGGQAKIAPAICYELSVPEHAENAFRRGARIYLASVAKSAAGVDRACKSLSAIASKYSMTVLMSNCVGPCDNFESAGRSAAWNNRGSLIGQLNDSSEGLIILDTDTQQAIELTV